MLDRKYERQMNRKEKRHFEMEKLKKMNGKEKLEYLWMYYKIWLVVFIVIIALIYTGVQMYHGMTEKILLNVTIVDGQNMERTDLEKEVRKELGAEKKNETVRFNANLSSGEEDYNSKIALSALVGAEAVDVLICPENVYEQYQGQDGLLNLEKLLPEEAERGLVKGEALILNKNDYMEKTVGIAYEPIYVCVLNNTKNQENAVDFLKMLIENQ